MRAAARFLSAGLVIGLYLPGSSQAAVQVGVATPMQKVMIEGQRKGWPFQAQYEGWLASSYSLSLARGEHEAFQVVVIPDQNLTNARVSVSTLQPTGGQGAFNGTVSVWLVGYVRCSDQPRSDLNIQYPPYVVNYTGGWWPDPLLTFKNSCNINANDRVAFWVDVHALSNTPAGDYAATVTVQADGITPMTLPLSVKVWNFTLPAKSTLPTAFSSDNYWQAKWVYGNNDWDNFDIENKFNQMQQRTASASAGSTRSRDRRATTVPGSRLNNAFH